MYDFELPDPDNKPFKRAEGKYHDSRLTFNLKTMLLLRKSTYIYTSLLRVVKLNQDMPCFSNNIILLIN